MDSVTHFIAGGLTPFLFKDAPRSRWLIPFGVLCGEFPDIDVLAGTSPEAILAFHRGITHALVMQPVFALLLALGFHRLLKKGDETGSWTWSKTWLLACIALFVHVFLDCMTTYGTQIFLPFSAYRVALPAMFIIDFLLTVPLITFFVMVWRHGGARVQTADKGRVRALGRAALAWTVLYPMLALGVSQAATVYLQGRYHDPAAAQTMQRLHLTPDPFAPLYWKVVGEVDETSYRMASLFLPAIGSPLEFSTHRRARFDEWAAVKAQLPVMSIFTEFVTFPVKNEQREADGGRVLTFSDLRYSTVTIPAIARLLGRTDGIFLFQLRVTPDGSPVAWRFLRRGKDAPRAAWVELPPVTAQRGEAARG